VSWVCVGNDVVDLANPRTAGRSQDERFVARVFDPNERATVAAAVEPDLELWCHWAAKEAGYKAISKLVGEPPPFVHRAFRVAWSAAARGESASSRPDALDARRIVRRGSVSWADRRADVTVALHTDSVHAVAFAARGDHSGQPVRVRPRVARLDEPASAWAGSLEELRTRFSDREADAVYSLPSAAVRVGARGDLAELMGVAERRLEIVCAPGPASQRPPRVLLDGEETEADVTLSHDGPLIAWAIWVAVPEGPRHAIPAGSPINERTLRDRP
jgi:phosphopantetheinyl transferase (holo-ACP synthase)